MANPSSHSIQSTEVARAVPQDRTESREVAAALNHAPDGAALELGLSFVESIVGAALQDDLEPTSSTAAGTDGLADASQRSAAVESSRARLLTATEFLNDLPPDCIIDGLVYRQSTHLLTGAGKAGKSWLAFQLVMVVVAGETFLGMPATKAKVLLISLEMTAGMVRERMEDIARDVGIPMPAVGQGFQIVAPTADYTPLLDLGTDDGMTGLKDLVSRSGAALVVLDTLYRFLPGKDPSSNEDMGKVFGELNEVAQSTGAAIFILDHVAKGEQLGPVSHSGIGAQVKGGASRVIMGLRRTTNEGGGSWELNVDSHFGSWDEPVHYERPTTEAGKPGGGCVLCTPTRAYRLTVSVVRGLFQRFGERDDRGRGLFASKRRFIDALVGGGHATGNNDGAAALRAIEADLAASESDLEPPDDRPIRTRPGSRRATIYTWCADLEQAGESS